MDDWRSVEVAPERLARWLDGFAVRHGQPTVTVTPGRLHLLAPDSAEALLESRWPLSDASPACAASPASADSSESPAQPDGIPAFIEETIRARLVGIVLVRKERHAVALASGATLTATKVGRHYVQGRTKAGGWSQQRYARRRENQAREAFASAAEDVAAMVEPVADTLEALLLGGDAAGLAAVLTDPRLTRTAALAARVPLPRLQVGEPNRQALADFPVRFRAVTVRLNSLA